MSDSIKGRARAAYRVLRHDLVGALRARPAAQGGDAGHAAEAPFSAQSERTPDSHLALVVGHFSFSDWYATFGDTAAMSVVADWLRDADIPFDVACHPANGLAGVDLLTVDPSEYTMIVFVCGPWTMDDNEIFLGRFSHCVKVGVNISVLGGGEHDFDLLLPRDLPGLSNADVVFAAPPPPTMPLVGVFMVHEQPEYGTDQRHAAVADRIEEYLRGGEVTGLQLDTVHVDNPTSTRDMRQLDGLLRRLDGVITTRLHGLVLSLRAGLPVVAIDPVLGGGKVTAQAAAIGWPLVLGCDDATPDVLSAAVNRCLDGSMAEQVAASATLARTRIDGMKDEFTTAIAAYEVPDDGDS